MTGRVQGIADGEEAHQLTIDEMPRHNHQNAQAVPYLNVGGTNGNNAGPIQNMPFDGGDQPHNNMQPFLVVNYIIKV